MEMYDDFTETAKSILAQTYDNVELVIVIDGNNYLADRTRNDFRHRGDVVVTENDKNLGLLESRNRGVELATGDVVAFIDDDAIADERWIESLVSAYENNDTIAVGGRMTPKWVAGKPPHLPVEFYWLVGVTHKGFADGAGEVRNTFGSNISFRRDVFLDLGGFNTRIGGRKQDRNLQGGETELCARMRREYGQGVYYKPEATVAHKVFRYRTRTMWLLRRAFWQGYSKRAMESLLQGSEVEENEFLDSLTREFLPARVRRLVASPSFENLLQIVMLMVLTGTVGVGYLYGIARWG